MQTLDLSFQLGCHLLLGEQVPGIWCYTAPKLMKSSNISRKNYNAWLWASLTWLLMTYLGIISAILHVSLDGSLGYSAEWPKPLHATMRIMRISLPWFLLFVYVLLKASKLQIFPYVYVFWTSYGLEWALKARDASAQILYLGATTFYIYMTNFYIYSCVWKMWRVEWIRLLMNLHMFLCFKWTFKYEQYANPRHS